jgi:glycosyltransferase involved in cell wall biosynthesis
VNKLVFVTQTLDARHPALAQTLDLVTALAERAGELVVICQSVGEHEPLPANVRVVVFGSSSRLGRVRRFLRAVLRELGGPRRADAVLAHMVPLYVVLAAPVARVRGARVGLWYTHWHSGFLLRLATRLADVVLSVERRSFPIDSPKVRGIGHAIDVERFAPRGAAPAGVRFRLLAVGRTARWKGYDTMLAGLERAAAGGCDAELEIRGPQLTEDERAHVAELERSVAASEVLRGRVAIEPPLPRAELPELFAGAHALVSAHQPRAGQTLDKVVYEAAACGVPVLASNPALAAFLGDLPLELRFEPRDADGLAARVRALAAADEATRAAVGAELRRRVESSHSLGSWADAVAAALGRPGT